MRTLNARNDAFAVLTLFTRLASIKQGDTGATPSGRACHWPRELRPDGNSYACAIKACAITKQKDFGKQLLDAIVKLEDANILCYNACLDACARAGDFDMAQEVLGQIDKKEQKVKCDVESFVHVLGALATCNGTLPSIRCSATRLL
mmetsp:Transcript_84095/g.238431  ORF Transcript_84095/g.238431 Transcript_84095/m.238431 type:complete len:147 (+) Transcript_84095:1755-2195(+)